MLRVVPQYPDAKSPSSFEDGLEFQDWVCDVLARKRHIIIQNLSSRKYQFEYGENLQGIEIKLDRRCTETGRLSIEIAEKSAAHNNNWVPSGIYRNDNTWLYIQGNQSVLFLFARNLLRRYHAKAHPLEHEEKTVKGYFLKLDVAHVIAATVVHPGEE